VLDALIVVSRFDSPEGQDVQPLLRAALEALAVRPGFVRGRAGRAVDEPGTWVLTTEWADVGAYRRSLSSYDVKVATAALFALARPEPSAFEVLLASDEPQPLAPGPSGRAATPPETGR
jgi:quinol monooxygenase YgiN